MGQERMVLHQREEGLPEVNLQRQQALCAVPCSDRAHPKYRTGGTHLLPGVVRFLGGSDQASRFLLAWALKRDADRGISRHIVLLLSEGKDTARCEHVNFLSDLTSTVKLRARCTPQVSPLADQ